MSSGTDGFLARRLQEKRKDEVTLMLANRKSNREWQCTECGFVVEARSRPKQCSNCNCVNGDLKFGVNLFAPREVVGWYDD